MQEVHHERLEPKMEKWLITVYKVTFTWYVLLTFSRPNLQKSFAV